MPKVNTGNIGKVIGAKALQVQDENTDCGKNQKKSNEGIAELPEDVQEGRNYTVASGGFAGEPPLDLPSYSYWTKLSAALKRLFLPGLDVGEFEMPMCEGDPYPVGGCYQKGHSEIRILAEAMKVTGGNIAGKTLVININLIKDKADTLSRLPCPNCHKVMCKIADNCEFDITICDNDNNEINLKDHCDGDKYSGENRTELEDKLPDIDMVTGIIKEVATTIK